MGKVKDWTWNPRFDADLWQRCLTLMAYSYILSLALPQCFLFYQEVITTLVLAFAIAKSALQRLPAGKAVLITGCDTGFGFNLAKHLHKLGFIVYATCLNKNGPGGQQLQSIVTLNFELKRMHVLQVDVTKDEDWEKAVAYIKSTGSGLWGIVNNAGWSTFGDLEWTSMEDYEKIINANLFGGIRGIKKCLPLIRSTGKGGRIVGVTSILARYAVPSRSAYVMSKFAFDGLLHSLRHELLPFGIHVSTLEADNYLQATSLFDGDIIKRMADKMWNESMTQEVKQAYGKSYFNARVAGIQHYVNISNPDISPVIDAYTNSLVDVWPQKRYSPQRLTIRIRVFIATHLPDIVHDCLYIDHPKIKAD